MGQVVTFPKAARPRPLYASWEYWQGVEDTHRVRLEDRGLRPERARQIAREAVDHTLERLIGRCVNRPFIAADGLPCNASEGEC